MIAVRRVVVWAGAHTWLGWLLCLPLLFKLASWVTDTDPPFEFLSRVETVAGSPGGEVSFEGEVRRDLDRDCSVSYSRHIVDSRGFRHDFEIEPRHLSSEGLRKMALDMDNKFRLVVNIPKAAAVGPAVYATELRYICNPLQIAFPITVHTALPFEVLPAASGLYHAPHSEARP